MFDETKLLCVQYNQIPKKTVDQIHNEFVFTKSSTVHQFEYEIFIVLIQFQFLFYVLHSIPTLLESGLYVTHCAPSRLRHQV